MTPEKIQEALHQGVHSLQSTIVDTSCDFTLLIDSTHLHTACQFLKKDPNCHFDYLRSVAGVDLEDKLMVSYHLFSYTHRHALTLRVHLNRDEPKIDSLSDIWEAANWHEREQFDLFGIVFTGHPDLRRLLLPEDWIGHPLLKDYEYPDDYHGIDHHRDDPLDQFKALDDLVTKAKEAKKSENASADAPAPSPEKDPPAAP